MKKTLLLTILGVLGASSASAQTGALTAITVQFYQNGAVLPAQVQTIALPGGAVCGQPLFPNPPAPITYITTTAKIVWSDPADATKNCIATQAPGSVMLSLPLGANYTMTATFTDDRGGVSPLSNVSNSFTRGAAPLPPAPNIQIRP